MKKTTKRYLKAILICCVAGAGFCLAGLIFGFRPAELKEKVERGDLEFTVNTDWQEKIEDALSSFSAGKIEYVENEFTDVDSLNLNLGTESCKLIPVEGDTWKVVGKEVSSGFSSKKKGDTLMVNAAARSWKFWENSSGGRAAVEIYIPKDQLIDDLTIDAGVGTVSINDGYLSCREFAIDSGVGSVKLSLDIRKKATIDCGVGSVELNLLGKESDFDYDLDTGVGKLTIDGRSYSGLGEDQRIKNHASKSIMIDCGVGKTEVNFFTEF